MTFEFNLSRQGGYLFVLVSWFVYLYVSRITQKVMDEFHERNKTLWPRNNRLDFGTIWIRI